MIAPLYRVVAMQVGLPGFIDQLGIFVGVRLYREQGVERTVQGYEGFAYVPAERRPRHGVLDFLRPARVVVFGLGAGIGRVELFPVDSLRDTPVEVVVKLPEELRALCETCLDHGILRSLVLGVPVLWVMFERRGKIRKQVRSLGAPKHALPIHAAVVELWGFLQGIARQVAAVGNSRDVRATRKLLVVLGSSALGSDRQLLYALMPFGYRVTRHPAAAVESRAAVALVGRGVGVALRQDEVADHEVVCVLSPHPGRAGDHQL